MANTANVFSVLNPEHTGPFFFTAEHASNALPCHHTESDQQFLNTHWAIDIGIADLLQKLCFGLSCCGIQTEFSRLWIDANRAPTQEGLIKEEIYSIPLSFNQNLSSEDIDFRKDHFHRAYHEMISQLIQAHPIPPLLVSLHSFTPIWNDHIRTMDIGVLFDRDEEIAHILANILQEDGFFVALNKPYSGKNGLIYSADRHGTEQNIPYVEFEFNQSILCTEERISFVAARIIHALQTLHRNYPAFFSRG